MTNELEKQFFQCFGIESKTIIEPRYSINTEYYEEKVEKYPQITDRILLELICILIKFLTFGFLSHNVEKLKNEILTDLRIKKDVGNIYDQVRTLFEEG